MGLAIGLAIASAANGSFLDPFQYAGGERTLLGLLQNDASNGSGGAGVFAGAGFGSNMVNMFLADLSNGAGGQMSSAGVTLFVMWGNGESLVTDYSANIAFMNMFNVGEDGLFTEGVSEVFALGEGVSILDGIITVTRDGVDFGTIGPSTETPRGFAITNLQAADNGELTIWSTELAGSILTVGLYDYGDDEPMEVLFQGDDLIITRPLVVPLPPPLGLALAGLIGVVLFRRRMAS